jgi:hypothetical protein
MSESEIVQIGRGLLYERREGFLSHLGFDLDLIMDFNF